jgi:hypothetical protein
MAINPVRELERKANGLSHLRFVGMASLFVIVVVDVTRLSVWVERRRYEARVEVGCVRRGSRR